MGVKEPIALCEAERVHFCYTDAAAQGRLYSQKTGSISTCDIPGSTYYGKDLFPQLLVNVAHRGSLNIGSGMTKTLECFWIKTKDTFKKTVV